MFMKALPAYKSNEKKKEKKMLTMEINKLMDEATAMKKEAAVGR